VPAPPRPSTSTWRPSGWKPKWSSARQAQAVEQRAAQAAVGVAAQGVDGAGALRLAVQLLRQRERRCLVRDRQPQARQVVGRQRAAHKGVQLRRRHRGRHEHRVHPMGLEQGIEDLGRPHLGDRVTEHEEDLGVSVDEHGSGGPVGPEEWKTGPHDRGCRPRAQAGRP
jgi:hypothetical protein